MPTKKPAASTTKQTTARKTTTSKKPAASEPKQPPAKKITASKINVQRALKDLGIDRPYYSVRVVGNRLELALYGGDVVTWPAAASEAKQPPAPKE